MVFVPVLAWLLVAQTMLLPLARAHAAQAFGVDSALAVVCSASLPIPGVAGEDNGNRKVHDFGCCTLQSRINMDLPVALPAAPAPVVRILGVSSAVVYALPQGRAPPDITATPRAARAPPALS